MQRAGKMAGAEIGERRPAADLPAARHQREGNGDRLRLAAGRLRRARRRGKTSGRSHDGADYLQCPHLSILLATPRPPRRGRSFEAALATDARRRKSGTSGDGFFIAPASRLSAIMNQNSTRSDPINMRGVPV
jgi:hypothetical protein